MTTPAPSTATQVALHLAFPAAIEEDVIDFCHDQAALLPGFTLFSAEGFGASGRLLTAVETVMGRARRRVLLSVLDAEAVDVVLAALRVAIPSPDVVYWTTPVERFGRLA